MPTASRAAFTSLVETITKSGMDFIFLNGNPKIDSLDLYTAHPRADNGLMVHLGLKDQDVRDDATFNVDFTRLSEESESTFQKGHLTTNFFGVRCAHALDLSSKFTQDGPFFKPAQQLIGVENSSVYLQTCKPDGTSTVAPMDLEIKSDCKTGDNPTTLDWQVLNQAVERVAVRMHLSGYLKFAVAFAVTGRSAWCVLGKREFLTNKSEKQIVSLHIERVKHVAVKKLWLGITRKSEAEPTFFLTEDGPLIWAALNNVGLLPWLCRIKWLASSMSRVYAVTKPKYYTWGGNQKTLGINATDSATYALKVVRGTTDYDREVAALTAVATETDSKKLDFYALGCFKNERIGSTRFAGHASWADLGIEKPLPDANHWWGRRCFDRDEYGGVIFMRVGIDDSTVPWTDLVGGACESLRLAHSAGYLHCDIRRSNIMKFRNKWCLIDFGLSLPLSKSNSDAYELEPGAQADGVGPRVRGCYDQEENIHWTIGDDYEMLLKMLLSL
jgi:hypothetical protein